MEQPALADGPSASAQLCDLLGIERPVLGAPMAKVSGGELAAAVTAAGGLGIVGGGYGDLEWIDAQFEAAAGSRVGIGLIAWNMSEGALAAALVHEPAAVWLSFGDPEPHLHRIHDAGAVSICQVGTPGEAKAAVDAGAQVIVAQGLEAGGHGRGAQALPDLLRSINDAHLSVPVVAAGGINHQKDFEALFAFGAAGVALGSVLYATAESLDTDAAKNKLVASSGRDTVQSLVYDYVRGPLWPGEYTARSIETQLTNSGLATKPRLARAS